MPRIAVMLGLGWNGWHWRGDNAVTTFDSTRIPAGRELLYSSARGLRRANALGSRLQAIARSRDYQYRNYRVLGRRGVRRWRAPQNRACEHCRGYQMRCPRRYGDIAGQRGDCVPNGSFAAEDGSSAGSLRRAARMRLSLRQGERIPLRLGPARIAQGQFRKDRRFRIEKARRSRRGQALILRGCVATPIAASRPTDPVRAVSLIGRPRG